MSKKWLKILIADITFENNAHLEAMMLETRTWDEDEFYIIAEDILPKLEKLGFDANYYHIFKCAGAIEMIKQQ